MEHTKSAQLQDLPNFQIADEQLEAYLSLNFAHLGLTRSPTQEEDVSLITLYTKCKFLGVIFIFQELGVLTVDKPQLIPSIANIVNQHSPQVPLTPNNFLGKLYPPQASLIQRMCELEENPPTLTFQSRKDVSNPIVNNFRFQVGLITERLSFGKTFCLPALICHKFAPIPYETTNKTIIPTNVIICGSKVAKEWRANINKHVAPTITRLVIETAKDLTTCEQLIRANSIPNIIVIKDGEITWKASSSASDKGDSTTLKKKALGHFLSILFNPQSDYSPDAKFLRIIYDDYDMLKFSAATILPRAQFSWFVSGTEEYHPGKSPQFYYTLNDEEKTMTIVRAKVILDNISAVSCNRDYSAQEFNVPKINMFQTYNESEYIVKCIIENTFNESFLAHDDWKCGALFTGNVDNPPQDKRIKILIATKDKDDQIALTNKLGSIAVRLTRANIDKFAREDALVGVCGNLYGINMGFLTHIIVDYTFADNEIVQIIGRGQRLSRKYNLQVYFRMRHPKYTVDDISSDEISSTDECVDAPDDMREDMHEDMREDIREDIYVNGRIDIPEDDNVPIQKNNE